MHYTQRIIRYVLVIYEPAAGLIGIIHAGWRGTVSRITEKAILKMKDHPGFDPGRVVAVIGPSIGRCCYEVDTDVASRFYEIFGNDDELVMQSSDSKYIVDLVKANSSQLISCGVYNIETTSVCTKCNEEFPSFRRDGRGTCAAMAGVSSVESSSTITTSYDGCVC